MCLYRTAWAEMGEHPGSMGHRLLAQRATAWSPHPAWEEHTGAYSVRTPAQAGQTHSAISSSRGRGSVQFTGQRWSQRGHLEPGEEGEIVCLGTKSSPI